jgi:hypothetical protein
VAGVSHRGKVICRASGTAQGDLARRVRRIDRIDSQPLGCSRYAFIALSGDLLLHCARREPAVTQRALARV